jgi:MSHA biogenesis protein MshK
MVESVKDTVAWKVAGRAGIVLVCALSPMTWAQSLIDPTRPADQLGKAQDANAVAAGPVLQWVFISSGRKTAVISGHAVNLGEKYGDAQVVKITESEVVLRNGKDSQTLKLYPNVEKISSPSRRYPKADTRSQ